MQKHGVGIHRDKVRAHSTPQSTLKYLKTYLADLPKWPKYLEYLKKSSHLVSVVREGCNESGVKRIMGRNPSV